MLILVMLRGSTPFGPAQERASCGHVCGKGGPLPTGTPAWQPSSRIFLPYQVALRVKRPGFPAAKRTWEDSSLQKSVLHASGIKDNAPSIRQQVLLHSKKGRRKQ